MVKESMSGVKKSLFQSYLCSPLICTFILPSTIFLYNTRMHSARATNRLHAAFVQSTTLTNMQIRSLTQGLGMYSAKFQFMNTRINC